MFRSLLYSFAQDQINILLNSVLRLFHAVLGKDNACQSSNQHDFRETVNYRQHDSYCILV